MRRKNFSLKLDRISIVSMGNPATGNTGAHGEKIFFPVCSRVPRDSSPCMYCPTNLNGGQTDEHRSYLAGEESFSAWIKGEGSHALPSATTPSPFMLMLCPDYCRDNGRFAFGETDFSCRTVFSSDFRRESRSEFCCCRLAFCCCSNSFSVLSVVTLPCCSAR